MTVDVALLLDVQPRDMQHVYQGSAGAEIVHARYTDAGVVLPRYTVAHALSGGAHPYPSH